MRKSRSFVRNIVVCMLAVMLSASAFFYAPIEVEAEEVIFNSSVANINNLHFTNAVSGALVVDFLDSEFNNDDYYYFKIRFDVEVITNPNIGYIRNFSLRYADRYLLVIPSFADSSTMNFNETREVTFCSKGSWLKDGSFSYDFRVLNADVSLDNASFDVEVDYEILESIVLTGDQSSAYEQGYNAGYSAGEAAGEAAGESNGYSSGYSDGYEAGEQSGYDSGFQAGVDSVDTQSYYDAGYNAGYSVGYNTGYEEGYDLGYEEGYEQGYADCLARLQESGADTADYPLLLSQIDDFDLQFTFIEVGADESVISTYDDSDRFWSNDIFNPNHTYKLDFTYQNFTYDYDSYFTSAFSFWMYWGDCSYPLLVYSGTHNVTTSVFIPGDKVGNALRFRCDLAHIESNGSIDVLHYFLNGCSLKLYDMGAGGDTQNQIANQTDQLTNGFDSSSGDSLNNDLALTVNDYNVAEDSLFNAVHTGLDDFEFFDFESVPAMITGITFVTSIMDSIFNAMGGASGAGIVLSVLFSVVLGSIALGLTRYFVSDGKGKKKGD